MTVFHTPVLGRELVSALAVRPDGAYVDCTVGEGGHAEMILSAVEPPPRLLGIDLDADALRSARVRLAGFEAAVSLVQGNYGDVGGLVAAAGFEAADGIIIDLGVSSLQLESPERGFSFRREERLDMRFDRRQAQTAFDLVNRAHASELAELIRSLGEESRSRRIASAIVAARPIETTTELAAVVVGALGGGRRRIHPATRTFQALRMSVNGELDNLRSGLEQSSALLAPGGRLAVIAYHSLEDRLVKRFMAVESRDCICPREAALCECGHRASLKRVNRKVIKASQQEISANPRSRSARMRVAERLAV
ncbi:MAG: 16S rRNA (cytosine(1402)-N(4))-methyltransferase RsmH [Dehalococcoidia bacterium]|nr:16S rRNA (cytosine(1402)-N(4))-methyltransferase RsmH [Dehalococcoidia bacterium]